MQVMLDEDAVQSARDILKGKYDDMVAMFLDNSRERIDEIKQGIDKDDAEAVIRPAHTLKSTSRQMGAFRLAEIALMVEKEAKAIANEDSASEQQNMDHISQAITDLSEILAETEKAFDDLGS